VATEVVHFPDPDLDSDIDDDEEEVMGIPCATPQAKAKKPSRNSYLANSNNNIAPDAAACETGVIGNTNFKFMSWVSYWECQQMDQHCTVAISVPSGLYQDSLAGKMVPYVAPDGMSLFLKCEWPEMLYDCDLMGQGFSNDLSPITLGNMVHASKKTVLGLKKSLGVLKHHSLGGLCQVALKFEVERKPLFIVPMQCADTDGVALYVILRKHVTETEDTGDIMQIRKIAKKETYGRYESKKRL
jgi:hypothetical protein